VSDASAEAAVMVQTATVVVGQRVKVGRSEEFRRWQNGTNTAAAAFEGFVGSEVVEPADESADWTIIYRFDTVEHLYDWLNSPTRADLLERGADLFDGAPSQQVMEGATDQPPVTVVVSHPVRPEDEQEFVAWQARITRAEEKFPGFRGAELFKPVPTVQSDWTAVYRFATQADLQRWLDSPERAALLREGEHFQQFKLQRVGGTFGNWFSLGRDGAAAPPPPDWKTALSVEVGLYPTVMVLTIIIAEIWTKAKLWQSALLGTILSVALLTWVVMPVVTRGLRFWLTADPGARQPATDVRGLLVAVGLIAAYGVLFWLVTVQLWTLP
jgi:antibiotic biosynthesis monooxygenase (ABM) superfamily enzyme